MGKYRKGLWSRQRYSQKSITRKTAERLLQEFLQRVEKINPSDEYAYYIKQVILFGSYLGDSPTLGDIDLSLTLAFRDDEPEKRSKHCDKRIKIAEKQGRHIKSFFERLIWPHEEILRFLKNRSPSISNRKSKFSQKTSHQKSFSTFQRPKTEDKPIQRNE